LTALDRQRMMPNDDTALTNENVGDCTWPRHTPLG
jgi:hypothetical protein